MRFLSSVPINELFGKNKLFFFVNRHFFSELDRFAFWGEHIFGIEKSLEEMA